MFVWKIEGKFPFREKFPLWFFFVSQEEREGTRVAGPGGPCGFWGDLDLNFPGFRGGWVIAKFLNPECHIFAV